MCLTHIAWSSIIPKGTLISTPEKYERAGIHSTGVLWSQRQAYDIIMRTYNTRSSSKRSQ